MQKTSLREHPYSTVYGVLIHKTKNVVDIRGLDEILRRKQKYLQTMLKSEGSFGINISSLDVTILQGS